MSLSGMPSTSHQPRLERLSCCGPLGNVDECDAREVDGLGVPVAGILDQDDLLALGVALQDERAGADHIFVRVRRARTRRQGHERLLVGQERIEGAGHRLRRRS